MARNKLLTACALAVLTTALYGCSSSDSGPTQAELDAAEAAAAAAAAEAERVKAEAEAAAAAAAAAAAEAEAQAEAEKQAAIEAARQAAILEQQQMAVMAAVAAADAAVDALMDDSSDADVAGAHGRYSRGDGRDRGGDGVLGRPDRDVRRPGHRDPGEADAGRGQHQGLPGRDGTASEAQMQATAAERAKQAVEDAIMALTAAETAANTAEGELANAEAALATAQMAVTDAADNDALTAASAALATALMQVSTASADYSVKALAVADATTALSMARDDLAEADPDHVALQAANQKLAEAATAAQEQADRIKELEDQIAALKKAEEDRMQDEADAAEEERMEEMAEAGKALKAVLDPNPLAYAVTVTSLTGAGVMATMNHDRDDGTTGLVTSPRLAPGDSAGSLGSWKGTHYAHKNTGTGVSNSAILYTNQDDPEVEAFATGATFGADQAAFDGAYDAESRTLSLGAGFAGGTDIAGDMFPTAGTTNYTPTAPATDNILRGTYQGAPGSYRCTVPLDAGLRRLLEVA